MSTSSATQPLLSVAVRLAERPLACWRWTPQIGVGFANGSFLRGKDTGDFQLALPVSFWRCTAASNPSWLHRGRKKAHFFRAAPKSPWVGVGTRRGRQYHPRSSATDLGELPAEGVDEAVLEINKKTDLKIAIESLERSKHRRVTSVTFAIKEHWRGFTGSWICQLVKPRFARPARLPDFVEPMKAKLEGKRLPKMIPTDVDWPIAATYDGSVAISF
jgi:hypothetical protein